MSEQSMQPWVSDDGSLNAGVECRRCGYSLRGLREDGFCPECGTPNGLSVRGDLLRFSDPGWLLTLSRGLALILWGILATFVFSIGGAVVGLLLRDMVLAAGLAFMASLIYVYGAYLFTSPNPRGIDEARYSRIRKFIRIALLMSVISALINVVSGGGTRGRVPLPLALTVIVGALQIVAFAGEWARLRYMRALAERIPDLALMNRAGMLSWSLPITWGLMMLLALLASFLAARALPTPAGAGTTMPASFPTSANSWQSAGGSLPNYQVSATTFAPPDSLTNSVLTIAGCLMPIFALLTLVLVVMWLFLHIRMRRALKTQAMLAVELWRSHGAHARP